MPKVFGTRKQRAYKLYERLRDGPAALDDAAGCKREDYDLWFRTWVLKELELLVPELKKPLTRKVSST